MVLKSDQERIKALLKDTITLLCRNGLTFKTEFSIEALIGITLDQDDVLLVNINEIVRNELGAKLNAARQQEEAGGNDWSDDYSGEDSGTPSPSNSGGRKRRRKRRRSSGQGSKGDDQESDGGGGDIGSGNSITGADDGSLTEPPNKRSITSRMKDLVKQEQDDDDKDIVFIKEEMDSGDWGSSSQAPDNFPSDLSAIPSSSGTSQQQQENFDFLQGNTLVPMGGSSQQNASMWADMTGRQNIMSPASKRTSAVNPNPGAPMGDESQQIRADRDEGYMKPGGNQIHISGVLTEDHDWASDVKDEVESVIDSPFTSDIRSDCLSRDPPLPSMGETSTLNSSSVVVTEHCLMPPPGQSVYQSSDISSQNSDGSASSAQKPPEKQFRMSASGQLGQVCPTCGKVLTSPRGFKLHVDAHKGIFPLHCPYCNRGFLSNSALRGHLVVHTNKKEFKCLYCAKEFKYRNGLDYHHAFCQARYKDKE